MNYIHQKSIKTRVKILNTRLATYLGSAPNKVFMSMRRKYGTVHKKNN